MSKKLLEKIKILEENQLKLVENLPKIIINILIKEGVLHRTPLKEEWSDKEIFEYKNLLNQGEGPKIRGTKDMTKEEFETYYNQLKGTNIKLAEKKLIERTLSIKNNE